MPRRQVRFTEGSQLSKAELINLIVHLKNERDNLREKVKLAEDSATERWISSQRGLSFVEGPRNQLLEDYNQFTAENARRQEKRSRRCTKNIGLNGCASALGAKLHESKARVIVPTSGARQTISSRKKGLVKENKELRYLLSQERRVRIHSQTKQALHNYDTVTSQVTWEHQENFESFRWTDA